MAKNWSESPQARDELEAIKAANEAGRKRLAAAKEGFHQHHAWQKRVPTTEGKGEDQGHSR